MSASHELFKAGFDHTDRAIALVEMLKAATHASGEYFPDPILLHTYSAIMEEEMNKAREFFDRLALQVSQESK